MAVLHLNDGCHMSQYITQCEATNAAQNHVGGNEGKNKTLHPQLKKVSLSVWEVLLESIKKTDVRYPSQQKVILHAFVHLWLLSLRLPTLVFWIFEIKNGFNKYHFFFFFYYNICIVNYFGHYNLVVKIFWKSLLTSTCNDTDHIKHWTLNHLNIDLIWILLD